MTLTTDDYKAIFVTKAPFMSEEDFNRAVLHAKTTKKPLEQTLMERAYISTAQYLQLLSAYCKTPATELRIGDINHTALNLITSFLAEKVKAIPFAIDGDTVRVAMTNPLDEAALNDLQQSIPQTIEPYVTTEQAIRHALVLYDKNVSHTLEQGLDEKMLTDKKDVGHVVDVLIEIAVIYGASDIHLEPFEDNFVIRMRVQGLLQTFDKLPTSLVKPFMTHLKIRSNLKVDETRLPQDGRFSYNSREQEIDVRLSLVPSMWGEKAVLRILPKETQMLDISAIGLLEPDKELIQSYLRRPNGMILVCGPTGCGKTTTLYAFLQAISSERIDIVNVSTIEDPIEYTIPRVTQIQTNAQIDLTFSAGLRALLRQDPDIIMVGEIRDPETANFAVRASLIGRLIMSSLHTSDSVGAIPRLLDMGIEPYLVSSTLSIIIAQRLARKLCTYCRESYSPDSATLDSLRAHHSIGTSLNRLKERGYIAKSDMEHLRFYKAVGCDQCNNTGYAGRTALFEILELNDVIRQQTLKHSDSSELHKAAMQSGMKTIFEDGLVKALDGHIDLSELLRVAYDE